MPFELDLPPGLRKQRWKVKIREFERLEPPHVTVIRGQWTWRYDLRSGRFLDRHPPAREVPAAVVRTVREHLPRLRAAWDEMYPENPVGEL